LVATTACLCCGHVECCDSSVGLHATKHFQKAPQSGMKPFRINGGNDSRDYIRRIKLRSSELTSVRRYKPIHVVAAIMMSQPFY